MEPGKQDKPKHSEMHLCVQVLVIIKLFFTVLEKGKTLAAAPRGKIEVSDTLADALNQSVSLHLIGSLKISKLSHLKLTVNCRAPLESNFRINFRMQLLTIDST